MCVCIYNFLWILLSVCVSYYTWYDMIHDTIWYTIQKNKIHDTIHILTTMLVGIIVWEDTFEHSSDTNNKLKKIKDLERKKEREFVWFGMKAYIHRKVFDDHVFTIELCITMYHILRLLFKSWDQIWYW